MQVLLRNRASAKKAGTQLETDVANYLEPLGAFRRAKAGAKDQGDVHLAARKDIVIECKNTPRSLNLGMWIKEATVEAANAKAKHGVIVHKRVGTTAPGEQWVTMTLEAFAYLLGVNNETNSDA